MINRWSRRLLNGTRRDLKRERGTPEGGRRIVGEQAGGLTGHPVVFGGIELISKGKDILSRSGPTKMNKAALQNIVLFSLFKVSYKRRWTRNQGV